MPLATGADALHSTYDFVVIGAGVSGSFIAQELAQAGASVLILEAGSAFSRATYPRHEIDANSRLYWGGGIEFNTSASLALLRPKVVGGGSIVNQALVDRFDAEALDSWRSRSGVSFLSVDAMAEWYERAEKELAIQEIPEKWWNGNARVFEKGFRANGFGCAPLRRAQSGCRYEDGNDCIECLAGCRIDSKQSMPVTTLRRALRAGAQLVSEFEVKSLRYARDGSVVGGLWRGGEVRFGAKRVVLAAGAIGNSKLLLSNGFGPRLPFLGKGFYTHPQYMVMGVYDERIDSHRGPLQSLKSKDPTFRRRGFKLENVFAPPVAISMLVPGHGRRHAEAMRKITRMACIEVAVRDTEPGEIRVDSSGKGVVRKELNAEDRRRKKAGMEAIDAIFRSTGAREVVPGDVGIGLHLMGGLAIGTDARTSVTAPDFTVHDHPGLFVADSSIFPDAPGINPSLTIMALSKRAAEGILKEER